MHNAMFRGRTGRWALLAALLVTLAGCGGDDDDKTAGAGPSPGGSAPPPTIPVPPPSSPAPTQPRARAATLEWTAPTTQTNGSALADLAGYRIHYGKSVTTLDMTVEVRNPSISSYVIEGLAPGTYYFAVSAFSSRNLESERSNAGRKEII
jgi:Fibronectin type III domain